MATKAPVYKRDRKIASAEAPDGTQIRQAAVGLEKWAGEMTEYVDTLEIEIEKLKAAAAKK